MKKFLTIICFFGLLAFSGTLSSCSPKVGCELNQEIGPKTDKRGNLKMKRGKSNLFDKKQRKRLGV